MRVLVLNTLVPFLRGGAEAMADGLVRALREHGHAADLARIPFKWYPPRAIVDHLLAARLLDVTESNGDRVDRVIPIKFPVYAVRHPEKVAWIAHQHRGAYDFWGTEHDDLHAQPGGAQVREIIREADARAFGECRAVFTIARNVSARLERYNGIASEPLYQPPEGAELFTTEAAEDYVFYPSRLNRAKRQHLVLEALAQARTPVRLVLAGAHDAQRDLDALVSQARALGIDDRITWRGVVDEATKRDLYARALAVVFPPRDEDYGFVTLEAMLSRKPVVTTTDAGGPLEFVRDGEEGVVVEPTAAAIAAAMDRLWEDRALAQRLGEAGRRRYEAMAISWETVVARLTAPMGARR